MTISASVAAPAGSAERIPLSLNHEFLCAFDRGPEQGAFSDRHTIVAAWRVAGPLRTDTLQAALDDLVERHEALRTVIVRGAEPRYQDVRPASPVPLTVLDLCGTDPADRDTRAERLLNELDAAPYPVYELPHLRAVLGRFDGTDAVLVLAVHHTATDAWSTEVLVRDLAACYAARRAGTAPDLPPAHQYREFAVWQQQTLTDGSLDRHLDYWRTALGDAEILAIGTDRPRRDDVPNTFAAHRFLIDAELTAATLAFARSARCSPFMVLLAAHTVVLHQRTGATDVVVPTFTSGRYQERFADSVGPFFNFLPLRTDLAGCGTFRDVVRRARTTCAEAYSHDIPFPLLAHELPALIGPFADPNRCVLAFELLQSASSMDGKQVGDLRYAEVRRRLISQDRAADIPDGGLWAVDILPAGEMVSSLKFNPNLYDKTTMVGLAAEFRRVLRDAVAAPDAPLQQI
jgi:hypothetical protein